MNNDNIVWKHLNWHDADLVTLARRAGAAHRFLEVAQRLGLDWYEFADGDARDFAALVPTERLEEFVSELRTRRIAFGTIDCRDVEALARCRKLGVDAALMEPLPLTA